VIPKPRKGRTSTGIVSKRNKKMPISLNASNENNDEKNQLDTTSVIYYHKLTLHISGIYIPKFKSGRCNLLHLVVSTVREYKVLVIGLCCSVCCLVIGVGNVVRCVGLRCYVSFSLEWVALWLRGGGVVRA
jgi:hypothetical protein